MEGRNIPSDSKSHELPPDEDMGQVETVTLLQYMRPCNYPYLTMCYVLEEDGSIIDLAPEIEGFDLRWGFKTTIVVEKTEYHIENSMIEGPFFKYKLISIVEEQEFREPFSIVMDRRNKLD